MPEPVARNGLSIVLEYVIIFVVAFALAYVLQNFLFGHFIIKQRSMEPNFYEYDHVLINRVTYKISDPKREDIVILEDPMGSQDDYIKRVIGLPGEMLQMKDGEVYINEKKIREPYISSDFSVDNLGPIRVQQGEFFVMGDNRSVSQDSRRFGTVTKAKILGRVMVIWWPLNHSRVPY